MAITSSVLVVGSSGTDGSTFTTASYSPGANRLLIAHIVSGLTAFATSPIQVSGHGLNWYSLGEESIPNGNMNSSLWMAWTGASPGTGSLTATFDDSNGLHTNCNWRIVEFADVNAHEPPQGALRASALFANAYTLTPTITLASTPRAGSVALGWLAHNGGSTSTITAGAQYTKLGADNYLAGPTSWTSAEWDNTTPGTTIDYTTGDAAGKVLIGLELLQALAVSITNPTRTDVVHASTVSMASTATFGTTTYTYAWTQLTGPAVSLSGGTTATASFTQPADAVTRTFRVTVTDSSGQTATATASITGTGVTDPPVASAGPDQIDLEPYATVTVPGSATGGVAPYAYAWTQVSGPTVTILNADTTIASFVVPTQASPEASVVPVVLRLAVTDDLDQVDTDDVSLTALPWDLWHRSSGAWLPRPPMKHRSSGVWID